MTKDGEKGKVLVIDEKEAELVRLIYDKFVNTPMGANSIAKWLGKHGYTKTVRQNGTTPNISADFVKLILDNSVYMREIAYGRRKTEKIEGTRNEVHVVKQSEDDYELYDGIHEAIVSEEIWYQAHAKRKLTGVKREKIYSLDHYHILFGLLKCPVCGAPMSGVVNRKKKKGSDEYYTDMWYYKCKNQIKVEGKPCTYRKHIRQDQLNAEMFTLMKQVLNDEEFKQRVASKVGAKEGSAMEDLQEERERLLEDPKKTENKKNRLLPKIGNLDEDDDLYNTLCEYYMGIVRQQTERLAWLAKELERNQIALENVKQDIFFMEMYYKMLNALLANLDEIPEEDLKNLVNGIVEKIEIYPEPRNGAWIKRVQFKLGLNVDNPVTNENGGNSLPNEKHDETVVLMSRVAK